jgi:exocyst complex component 3
MAQASNMDTTVALPRLEDLLRHPEDLDKIGGLKAEYQRKKTAVDLRLREGLRDQLEAVQRSISALTEGQRQVSKTKDELQGIDKLCAESQDSVEDFAQIDQLARIQRHFDATIMMKRGLENFGADLQEVEDLLEEDEADMEDQPNLLRAHMQISRLRDFRDEAMDQIGKAQDRSSEETLEEYFEGLDSVITKFDAHLDNACENLIELAQSNRSMVVRLAVVVMNEEKNDDTVRALQEAQKDHKDLASRFKSMNIGPKTVRGYKSKFIKAIEVHAHKKFEPIRGNFLDQPTKLNTHFQWFFNELAAVKEYMQSLVPKKWKIFETYTNIYHHMIHDFLLSMIDATGDDALPADNLLEIVKWSDNYYKNMAQFGWTQTDLQPNLLDDRKPELIQRWQSVIINAVEEWMNNIFNSGKKSLVERAADSLDNNAEGHFRTKGLNDMWVMLYQQVMASGGPKKRKGPKGDESPEETKRREEADRQDQANRAQLVEGIIDAMFRSLRSHQSAWQTVVDEECAKHYNGSADQEGVQLLQDWMIGIANDQISCIDDNEETGVFGYLTRFKNEFERLVTPKYLATTANVELEALRDGYVDLSTHCLAQFVNIVFTVDLDTVLPDIFTPRWYGEYAMKRITSTFEDYMADYTPVLHPSLAEILVEELSDELLVRYLSAVRNKGVKFRRHVDPFTEKFKDDVLTVFAFFENYPDSFEGTIKQKWRLVEWLVQLLDTDKGPALVLVYESFKIEYWDLQLSWVEAVLRTRDDFERSMITSIKAKAAELSVERGMETIMSRVR